MSGSERVTVVAYFGLAARLRTSLPSATVGRQFLTGGSGRDCGQLGAGIDERT
jgi:hypothetical protein